MRAARNAKMIVCTCSKAEPPVPASKHLDIPGLCYRELVEGACRRHHTLLEHVQYGSEPSGHQVRMALQEAKQ